MMQKLQNLETQTEASSGLLAGSLQAELKKNVNQKKREHLKFFATILLSNLVVALLCWSPKKEDLPASTKIAHKEFVMLEIPLTVLIDNEAFNQKEIPVTLLDQKKNIISQKAYLHQKTKDVGDLSYFKIEINPQEVRQVSRELGDLLVAVPYIDLPKPKNKITKERSYETHF